MTAPEKPRIVCPECEGTGGEGTGPERVVCKKCKGMGVVTGEATAAAAAVSPKELAELAKRVADLESRPAQPTPAPSVPTFPPPSHDPN